MKKNGFTLIELFVVIAILGVIAAVAVPNIVTFLDKGNAQSSRQEITHTGMVVGFVPASNRGITNADSWCFMEFVDGTEYYIKSDGYPEIQNGVELTVTLKPWGGDNGWVIERITGVGK